MMEYRTREGCAVLGVPTTHPLTKCCGHNVLPSARESVCDQAGAKQRSASQQVAGS